MDSQAHYGSLHKLFDDNFIDYTSYVIRERAIPDIADGLKPVQRRILQTLHKMDDGRFHKVANVVGDCMKLHPHGDASIFSALVNLANKDYLIERQGNFGNIYTGDSASAARYIECRLSSLARETLFNKDLTTYIESYDGRLQEPYQLPAKIPLLLLLGASGIAVGMATKIMPHNFVELLEAQKAILKNQPFILYPDFPTGGLVDITSYNMGNGRIKCRARIVEKDDKTIVIEDVPYSTTTESLIESIEKAAKSGKLKILSINDYTAENVEIEIKLSRGIYAADTIRALYAFTDCEVSISPSLIVIKDNQPVTLSAHEVLQYNTDSLVQLLTRELQIDLDRLKEKLHFMTLERIFIERRLYKTIEECVSYEAVLTTLMDAFSPYMSEIKKEITNENLERLLEIKIKRISRYDIDKRIKEMEEVEKNIARIIRSLNNIISYTIKYLDGLISKYGALYPRKTELKTFHEVEARKVALSNLTIGYDPLDGFLGYQIKGDEHFNVLCSEYDRLLLIFKDGMYKVINVCDKLFIGSNLLWLGKADEKNLFNMIYREGTQNFCYVKRFDSPKFILEKEYHLFPVHQKSVIQFLEVGGGVRAKAYFIPSPRSRMNSLEIRFDEYLVKGVSAIGKRIASRPVRRITSLARDNSEEHKSKPLFDKEGQETS